MKITYKLLLELDEKTIEEGLFGILNNALELEYSSDILAKNEKYAQAVALKILAIEELIKVHAVFLFRLGVRDEEAINFGFKKLKEHANIHQTRLKVASLWSYINSIKDEDVISGDIEQMFISKISGITPISGETLEEFSNRILTELPDLKTHTNAKQVLLERETKISQVENEKTWLTEAQTLKEKSMYVDLNEGKWQFPNGVSCNDYNEATKYYNELKEGHYIKIINDLKDSNETHRKLTFLVLSGLIKTLPIDYHKW